MVVVLLGRLEGPTVVSDRVQLFISICLKKNAAKLLGASVNVNHKRAARVRQVQYRRVQKSLLEVFKGFKLDVGRRWKIDSHFLLRQVVQRLRPLRVVTNETSVDVTGAKEALHLGPGPREGGITKGLRVPIVNTESPWADDMPKVLHLLTEEAALVDIERHSRLAHTSEDKFQMINVVVCRSAEDNHIVKVNQANLPLEAGKNDVKRALKSGRCVGEAKGHHQPLEQPIMCDEGGLLAVLLTQGDLPVACRTIQRREERCLA
ncbi:hypothetical protein MMPV_007537 [Pyropia vietnamensis]